MLIDEEAARLVAGQYVRAKQLLTDHKEKHQALAELLLEKEVVFSEDLERIFGARKWASGHVIQEDETKSAESPAPAPDAAELTA